VRIAGALALAHPTARPQRHNAATAVAFSSSLGQPRSNAGATEQIARGTAAAVAVVAGRTPRGCGARSARVCV